MAEFQFVGKKKFALISLRNVYTSFQNGKKYQYQLSDGTWIFSKIPVAIDVAWKAWIGKIHLEQLESSNLILMCCEPSTDPQTFNEHNQRLKDRLMHTFSLLQLSGVLEYIDATLLAGYFLNGKSKLSQMSEIPDFHTTSGYTRTPVTKERLEKATQLQKSIEKMESTPEFFSRLLWGWSVLLDGLQKNRGEERIHQFVRALEALILPEIGNTKKQFTHRCQTFAKANVNAKTILEEAFELRSMAEHLNNWEKALESHDEKKREGVALRRTRQMEQLALFAYSRVFENDILKENFKNDDEQEKFWKLRDDVKRKNWGTQLDLTSVV